MTLKTKKIIYWVLTGLVALLLTASAMAKLSGGAQSAEMAKGLGGETNVMLLGILELTIVVLWLIPRTGVAGALLMMAYMGGAMAVHVVGGQSVAGPLIIQMFIWIVAAYRFPELTQRLLNRNPTTQVITS